MRCENFKRLKVRGLFLLGRDSWWVTFCILLTLINIELNKYVTKKMENPLAFYFSSQILAPCSVDMIDLGFFFSLRIVIPSFCSTGR